MSVDNFTIDENSPAINFVHNAVPKRPGGATVDTAEDSI